MNTADLLRYTPLATANRLRIIVSVLAKHGFEELLERLGLRRRFLFWRKQRAAPPVLPLWKRIKIIMEELGPTAVKIGQILSMRPDMIPAELCDELKTLQENLPPAPYPVIQSAIETAFGRPLEELFTNFERVPVATASISQVHRARRADNGCLVAVKVRLPDVSDTMAADLDILEYFAELLQERAASVRPFKPVDVVRELEKNVRRELDFTNEAVNMLAFNDMFRENDRIFAPGVHADMVRPDVLVMDFIEGERLDEFMGTSQERAELAGLGLESALRQIMEEGFFHGDPHLGNLRIVGKSRLCYLDFGMCGRLAPALRSALVDCVIAMAGSDPAKLARVAEGMSYSVPPDLDVLTLESDLMFVIQKFRTPVGGGFLGSQLLAVTNICREHGLSPRPDFILVARAMLATEAALKTLHPALEPAANLAELAKAYTMRRLIPGLSDRSLWAELEETARLMAGFPRKIDSVLRKLGAGQLSVELKQHDFGKMPATFRLVGNRLGGALVTAALAVSSAVVFNSGFGPLLWGMPVIGLAGFSLAGLLGIFLTFKMFRDT
ncbi:MAG: AarF/ABC1/UbiB kinase family protein [Desulfovibrio sp.]|jgi:ubiquinone biosynthesis protein|nr:AarF/ABC1/UbiB kinase family protein [Desulfovibrio sp.]MBI4959947.1 AarF/ABC1/UbiB kinase family protein [Desulfovibrio sp.]